MLTGTLKSASDSTSARPFCFRNLIRRRTVPEGDLRRRFDRFQPENFHKNLELTDTMKTVADRVGCTPTQLALAWLMSNPTATVLPLPGSSRPEGVKEALGALEVELDEATLKEIRFAVDAAEVHGGRYNDQMKGSLEG
jgi:pyridoxine 4-dehydrogenase